MQFQHLCKTAREQCGTNVWGRLDDIADICLIGGDAVVLMQNFLLDMNAHIEEGELVGSGDGGANASSKARAAGPELSEDAMKQIAKDCVKLRKELAKKEAQVKRMNRDNGTNAAANSKSDAEAPKQKGTPAATKQPISSIPGTNRFYFSRTPGATARKHTAVAHTQGSAGSEKPTGMKKQFANNPTLQRSSVQVMYAAMGLPDEDER